MAEWLAGAGYSALLRKAAYGFMHFCIVSLYVCVCGCARYEETNNATMANNARILICSNCCVAFESLIPRNENLARVIACELPHISCHELAI